MSQTMTPEPAAGMALDAALICARCDGTGNELLSMYRRCSDCGGSGTARRLGPPDPLARVPWSSGRHQSSCATLITPQWECDCGAALAGPRQCGAAVSLPSPVGYAERLATLLEDFGGRVGLDPWQIEDRREESFVLIVDGWAMRITVDLLGAVEDEDEEP